MARIRGGQIPYIEETPVILPDRETIFWLQANRSDDELLPAPGAYYKLACSTVILDRAEIVTRWPERNHVFVVVKFTQNDINLGRLNLQAA